MVIAIASVDPLFHTHTHTPQKRRTRLVQLLYSCFTVVFRRVVLVALAQRRLGRAFRLQSVFSVRFRFGRKSRLAPSAVCAIQRLLFESGTKGIEGRNNAVKTKFRSLGRSANAAVKSSINRRPDVMCDGRRRRQNGTRHDTRYTRTRVTDS